MVNFEKIKELCTEKGINLHRLEMELGFSNGTLRAWDTASPRADRLLAVAKYFGVTVDDLIRK